MYEGRKTMIDKVMSFNFWIATIMFEKGDNIKDNIDIKYAKVMTHDYIILARTINDKTQ